MEGRTDKVTYRVACTLNTKTTELFSIFVSLVMGGLIQIDFWFGSVYKRHPDSRIHTLLLDLLLSFIFYLFDICIIFLLIQ